MNIQACTFEDILPIWRDHLWPGRETAIRPQSSMLLDGSHDKSLYERHVHFYKMEINKKIVAVNSVFETRSGEMRSRGLFVFPEARGQGMGRLLLEEAIRYTQANDGKILWSIPRVSAMKAYEAVGFEILRSAEEKDMEFGPNVYAVLHL